MAKGREAAQEISPDMPTLSLVGPVLPQPYIPKPKTRPKTAPDKP